MRTLSSLDRPAAHAEHALVTAILHSDYPPGAALPAERELAVQLGVTRPTLREALQRLARDGWLTIQQGKPTLVNDYWRAGGLGVLSALAHPGNDLPADFIPNLLAVRLLLAPAYTRAAVERDPDPVADLLALAADLEAAPAALAAFDWRVQHLLTVADPQWLCRLLRTDGAPLFRPRRGQGRLVRILPRAARGRAARRWRRR